MIEIAEMAITLKLSNERGEVNNGFSGIHKVSVKSKFMVQASTHDSVYVWVFPQDYGKMLHYLNVESGVDSLV